MTATFMFYNSFKYMSNSGDFVLVGEVLGTNGINGEIIVKLVDNSLNITPKQIFIEINSNESMMISYNVEYFKLKNSSEHILKLKEYANVSQANFLKGEKIYVNKGMLLKPDIETLVQKSKFLKHKRNVPAETEA